VEPNLSPRETKSTPESRRTLEDDARDFLAGEAVSQAPLLPPRASFGARLAAGLGRRHGVLLPLCAMLLWSAMTLRMPGDNVDLHFGQAAPRDIFAPHAATILDRELTRRNRDAAADLVPPEYDGRPGAQENALADLQSIVLRLRRTSPPMSGAPIPLSPLQAKSSSANSNEPESGDSGFAARPPSIFSQARAISPARWAIVERAGEIAVRAAYARGGQVQQIRSDVDSDLLEARARMATAMTAARRVLRLSRAEETLTLALAGRVTRYPNLVVNDNKTERARRQARAAVSEVYRNILPGSVLVTGGTRIDAARWAELQDLDLVAPRFHAPTALARLVLCILLVCFAATCVARLCPALLEQPASLWLAAMMPVAFVFLFRFLLRVPHGDQAMIPLVAIVAMSLTILFDARMGFICAFVLAALCALMARASSSLFLMTVLGASVGVLAVSEIASRFQLVRAGLILAATNVALALSFALLDETVNADLGMLTLWSGSAGVLAVGATAGIAMFLERPFGITTHLRLLELSAPDEVVMRRMQAEAPGTYTHSLMVAMLSEAAAKAVGADPLLCRVGGLYHDIGKLRRPHCFIENQSGENVHDRLAPQLSAMLIIAHVKDGLELGRALRLPQPVLDIIAQHHGTSLLQFFYFRATQLLRESAGREGAGREGAASPEKSTPEIETNILPDEEAFRYGGPRPQSKEAAIVLLADAVEASSRALPGLTLERLAEHIQTMIAGRLAETQLAECDLTLRDLQTIEGIFAHVLRGVLHQRIEYPDPTREAQPNWAHDALADPREEKSADRDHAERANAERASAERANARFPHLPRFERRQSRGAATGNTSSITQSGIVKAEKIVKADKPESDERRERRALRAQRAEERAEARRAKKHENKQINAESGTGESGATEIANGVHVAQAAQATAATAEELRAENSSAENRDQPFVEQRGAQGSQSKGGDGFWRNGGREDFECGAQNGGAAVLAKRADGA